MTRRVLRSGMMALVAGGIVCAGAGAAFAQDISVYYDEYGRRVIVDEQSGDIIRIEKPRQNIRQYQPRRPAPEGGDDSYAVEEEAPPVNGASGRAGPDENEFPAPPAPPRVAREFPEDRMALPEEQEPAYDYDQRASRGDDQPALPDYGDPLGDDQPALPQGGNDPDVTASVGGMARPSPIVRAAPTKDKMVLAGLQVLLDRGGASPGVIDGRWGQNVAQAEDAYREITGDAVDAADPAAIEAKLNATGGPAMISYTITQADLDTPFVAKIPVDYAEKAQLPRMAYTSPSEMFGERFHMDENFLKAINPGVDFGVAGSVITVANVGPNATRKVTRVVANKAMEQVRAYDETGRLVVAYPSTIGSSDTPSPSGTVQVVAVAIEPNYTYNPKINFKQGENDKVLTIPPGPNGPVGSIWIALSKPTYGIHGTPDPSQIGKTNSHGCVRLTNWDAGELAKLVSKGITVEFDE